jgi:hypothetical protein
MLCIVGAPRSSGPIKQSRSTVSGRAYEQYTSRRTFILKNSERCSKCSAKPDEQRNNALKVVLFLLPSEYGSFGVRIGGSIRIRLANLHKQRPQIPAESFYFLSHSGDELAPFV